MHIEWGAVGAIGGVLGAVGVILTVVFLAMQVRRNTAATQSQTYQAACSALAEFGAMLARDPAVCRIWRKGLSKPEDLETDEYYQFAFLGVSLLRRYENAFYQYHAALIDSDFWAGHGNNLLWHFHQAGFQRWWKERRLTFSNAFRNYLENSSPLDAEASGPRTL